MTKLRIAVMGTRGKSSMIRKLHSFFHENGYSVLSRETGLIPVVYDNDKSIFIKRDGGIPLSRPMETRILLEKFDKKKHDVIVFENNSIAETYMKGFNEFIHPDVVLITTITLDHILEQGGTLKEVAETFLKTVSSYSHIIFWTNHIPEYNAFKKVCREKNVQNVDILFSPLRFREKTIFQSFRKILDQRGLKYRSVKSFVKKGGGIPFEIFAEIKGRTFINIAHINDIVHTSLALNEIMARKHIKDIFLFLNLRADRPERVLVFVDAFLPLFKDVIKGVVVRCTSMATPTSFLIKRIKTHYLKSPEMPFFACETTDDLDQILTQIPKKSVVVMVGNTADDFGKELINKFRFFRESYPILENANFKL